MVAVTYGTAAAADVSPKPAVSAPRKSWFARFVDALIESRMRRAEEEIRKYGHLTPSAGRARGDNAANSGSGDMPFGGW